MNENPGETPNPLNPTPVAVGSTPNPMDRPMVQAAPVATQETPATAPTQAITEPVKSPEKKKKTGLIILVIVVLAMLIGGIAVAAVIMNRDSDPVSAAMNKITGGNIPANIVIDGNIHIENSDVAAPISSVDIDIDSSVITNSLINDSNVAVTASTLSGDISLDVEEMYAGGDSVYIKADGIEDVVEVIYGSSVSGSDTNVLLGKIIEVIDGEWIRISTDQLENLPIETTLNGSTECFEIAAKELRNNGNSLTEMYKKNSFLSSSSEKVTLASKKYPVRKLIIDDDKLIDYANAFASSNVYSNISSCIGAPSNAQVNESAVKETISNLPDIYVEIDDNDNFSRFYTTFELDNNTGNVIVDLSLSYPANLNISEPNEYTDLQDIIQQFLMNMFNFEMPTATDPTVDIYTEL